MHPKNIVGPPNNDSPRLIRQSKVVAATDNEVMLDQLKFLIEHTKDGICGCGICDRYLRARKVLMELFVNQTKVQRKWI